MALFALLWCAVFAAVTHWAEIDAAALIQEHWGLVLVGFLGAVVGNATAVGGGLIFVPYMMFFYDLTGLESLKLALVTQAFGMTSGTIAWFRATARSRLTASKPDEDTGAPNLAIRLLPSLVVGIWVSTWAIRPSPGLVKSVFGPVSIAIGLLMLILAIRPPISPRSAEPRARAGLLFATACGAAITGWAAVGVGEVAAAWLMARERMAPESAIRLGVVLLALTSIVLALVHWIWLGGLPWALAGFVILGAVFGARLGPVVASAVGPKRLKLLFAGVAILDGVLMLA